MPKTVDDIINKYYDEANQGLANEKAPSELNRGEGTEAFYYILKIDLCNSTLFFLRRSSQTYLKIAHVFLSTVDDITRIYGSDTKQVEYAGDSVVAYFPDNCGMASKVLSAAYWARNATTKMKALDPTFWKFPFKSRIILHYGKLILGKIGPWGDYNLTAIGMPLHIVAKLEKKVQPGDGLATKAFAEKLSPNEKKLFLIGNYDETTVEVQDTLSNLQGTPAIYPGLGLLSNNTFAITPRALYNFLTPANSTLAAAKSPRYETKRELIDYNINWLKIQMSLEGRSRP